MNDKSLQIELDKLKRYLKKIAKYKGPISQDDQKIISHTLVGMIMSIHNLIKTGAYSLNDFSDLDLQETLAKARHLSIHYSFFDDYNLMKEKSYKILEQVPENLSDNFANSLKNIDFSLNREFLQISSSSSSKIYPSLTLDNFYVFKNLKTQEKCYIAKEDLLIVENNSSHNLSYLIFINDNKNIFYKKSSEDESIKTSFKELKENYPHFIEEFILKSQNNKLSASIEKILNTLNDNPYQNTIINYKYDNNFYIITAHNFLKQLLHDRKIHEKILTGQFTISFNPISKEAPEFNPALLQTKNVLKKASLEDLFYMELFLKRYRIYINLLDRAKSDGKEISPYAKQSILLNLFELGASNLSQDLITADKNNKISDFYYAYKKIRNQLAHNPIDDKAEKEHLISMMESCTEIFYEFSSILVELHDQSKSQSKYTKIPTPVDYDNEHYAINNSTYKFAKFAHNSTCKIINGKKYLKLDGDVKNCYLDIDGSLLSFDYNTLISKECIVPVDHIKMVLIDPNTNEIKKAKQKIEPKEIIKTDQYLSVLLQAQDYLKTYPFYGTKVNIPFTKLITFYDKFGTPMYTESINNIIYRRLSQKIIPSQLLEATTLLIPKDLDEPLTIINKNKTIIAKVYWACINYIDKQKEVVQLLHDTTTRPIEYGKLLPKDLKTNEVLEEIKEVKKR